MDGVGVNANSFGNAVHLAHTPSLNFLKQHGIYTQLFAHGTAVGLPSDQDIGNSEVGHNALGAGRIFEQGASLVNQAITSGSMFQGDIWKKLISFAKQSPNSRLHFLGLLSDGNVHSHIQHLLAMIAQAKKDGVTQVFIHPLFDGRDVPEGTAEKYVEQLLNFIQKLNDTNFSAQIASGGGRMKITMDRYESDWSMVELGWKTHVLGLAEKNKFKDMEEVFKSVRQHYKDDQYFPEFVIVDQHQSPIGEIRDGDGVIFFNFRGDRAIEISKAFTQENFSPFSRVRVPKVFYAGMMQYDGDEKIPENFLVSPPKIKDTLTEFLIRNNVRQFACSESQKYGHVTYFWNGNRSGIFDKKLEDYLEIPSDPTLEFREKPWMKAWEITNATILRMEKNIFDFGRINFANGDMVGHTGDLEAATIAVSVVDLMLGRLMEACKKTNTLLIVTADHGNCDEMFQSEEKKFPDWKLNKLKRPPAKTSHTLNPVPFYIFDPERSASSYLKLSKIEKPTLGHFANTLIHLLGFPKYKNYLPSLIENIS